MITLYPVILAVPPGLTDLPLSRRQPWLSRYARQCLDRCAGLTRGLPSGFDSAALEKDDHGAPLPFQDTWWSVSHKPGYVAAVLAPYRTGIDVEKCAARPAGSLFKKILTPEEARLFNADRLTTFYRAWTAKEAVLKANGAGIGKLYQCRISRVISDTRMAAVLSDTELLVDQTFSDGHIAAVVTRETDAVEWRILPLADTAISP